MNCPGCGASNDDAAEVCFSCRRVLGAITKGTLVAGRYEVVEALGRGGMGTVYRAHDRALDEEVALKVLRPDLLRAEGIAARFRSEIKLARRVSHPNVCRIYEYGEDEGRPYISMELVRGEDLKERLRRGGPLAPDEAARLLAEVADGLTAVHREGIVHRDLKSANIMIGTDGRARVMDFGIAKAIGSDSASTGYVLGSPEYMSPEQARGRPVDARSDVYALGVVLFETITGDVPFRATTPVATLMMHVDQPPPLERLSGRGLSPALERVLRSALSKNPDERPASAAAMADLLRGQGAAPSVPLSGTKTLRLLVAGVAAAACVIAYVIGNVGEDRMNVVHETPPPASVAPSVAPSITAPPATAPPVVERSQTPPSHAPVLSTAPPTTLAWPPETAPAATLPAPPATTMEPAAATPPPTTQAETAWLLVVVHPWARVVLDGQDIGMTPLARRAVSPGPHTVLLEHPDFQPYLRKLTVTPGDTRRLVVDLPSEGVRRHR